MSHVNRPTNTPAPPGYGVTLGTTPLSPSAHAVLSPEELEERLKFHEARVEREETEPGSNRNPHTTPVSNDGNQRYNRLPGNRPWDSLIVVGCCRCGKTLLSPRDEYLRGLIRNIGKLRTLPPAPKTTVSVRLVGVRLPESGKACNHTFFVCERCA